MMNILKLAAIFLVTCSAATAAAQGGYFKRFESAALPKIRPPVVNVVVLKNGVRCFLMEDHSLPIVTMAAITRTGGIYDPKDKLGLALMAGILMRSGGAGEFSPDAFDKEVDGLGAVLASDITNEMGRASLKILSKDLERGVALMFDMLFKPQFDSSRMKVARLKIEESLRREDDDPKAFAGRNLKMFIYGDLSPWARRPDGKSLANITGNDLEAFHQKYFRTNNMLLAAAGDFDTKILLELLDRITSKAPQGEVGFPDVEKVELEFKPGVKQFTRPTPASFIRMGHLGIKRSNPDKYALNIMTDILGASNFKSRLMDDIRTKRGMAYSVWSDMVLGTDYGLFVIGVDTKSSQAAEAIKLIRGHVTKLATDGDVDDDELKFAKRSILTKLVFEFDSPFKVVDRRATFYFHGLPDNYWKIFSDNTAKVSASDIRSVAKRYLHPAGMKTVIVGPKVEGL